jgi:hypothetical protein
MLAGRTMEEAGREKFDGNLLGDAPQASFAEIVGTVCAAAAALSDADLERTVHCSFGDFTAREYFWQINSFRALRAHDIAKALGIDSTLPDELIQGVWDEISPHAEESIAFAMVMICSSMTADTAIAVAPRLPSF